MSEQAGHNLGNDAFSVDNAQFHTEEERIAALSLDDLRALQDAMDVIGRVRVQTSRYLRVIAKARKMEEASPTESGDSILEKLQGLLIHSEGSDGFAVTLDMSVALRELSPFEMQTLADDLEKKFEEIPKILPLYGLQGLEDPVTVYQPCSSEDSKYSKHLYSAIPPRMVGALHELIALRRQMASAIKWVPIDELNDEQKQIFYGFRDTITNYSLTDDGHTMEVAMEYVQEEIAFLESIHRWNDRNFSATMELSDAAKYLSKKDYQYLHAYSVFHPMKGPSRGERIGAEIKSSDPAEQPDFSAPAPLEPEVPERHRRIVRGVRAQVLGLLAAGALTVSGVLGYLQPWKKSPSFAGIPPAIVPSMDDDRLNLKYVFPIERPIPEGRSDFGRSESLTSPFDVSNTIHLNIPAPIASMSTDLPPRVEQRNNLALANADMGVPARRILSETAPTIPFLADIPEVRTSTSPELVPVEAEVGISRLAYVPSIRPPSNKVEQPMNSPMHPSAELVRRVEPEQQLPIIDVGIAGKIRRSTPNLSLPTYLAADIPVAPSVQITPEQTREEAIAAINAELVALIAESEKPNLSLEEKKVLIASIRDTLARKKELQKN